MKLKIHFSFLFSKKFYVKIKKTKLNLQFSFRFSIFANDFN
jgi:hypothetical protein